MYDVIVGATLAEVKAFKNADGGEIYRKWIEVTPRSADRLRGIGGVDQYILLPGFRALPPKRRSGVVANLLIASSRPGRGEVHLIATPRGEWWDATAKGGGL